MKVSSEIYTILSQRDVDVEELHDGHLYTRRQQVLGAIVDIGIYNLHNSLYAMGYPKPVRVSAITEGYISLQDPRFKDKMDVEEFGAAWIRFENDGVMVFIVVSKNNETPFEKRARGPRPYKQSSVKGKVSD